MVTGAAVKRTSRALRAHREALLQSLSVCDPDSQIRVAKLHREICQRHGQMSYDTFAYWVRQWRGSAKK